MKPTRNLFLSALGLSLAASLTANAAILTWDAGANTNNWSGSGSAGNAGNKNWDTNNAPATGDSLIFAGTVELISNNNTTADTSYAGITFSNTAGAFTLTGNRITLGGDVTNNDADLQTINMAMILSGNRTFNAAGDNGVGGNITVGGLISGSGFGIIKSGIGVLTLSAANTYTGMTTIRAGTLAVGAAAPSGADGALGNTTSAVILGDALTAATDAPSLLINGAFTVGREISVGSGATAAYNATIGGSNVTLTSTYLGTITLNTAVANYTTTLRAATGGTVDFNNLWITNNRAITIGSSGNTGTVKLSNVLATTGGISVNFGTFLLGASDRLGDTTPVTVAGGIFDTGTGLTDTVSVFNMSGGFLNGTGTITAATYGLSGGTVTGNLGTGTMNANSGATALNGTAAATTINIGGGTLTLGSAGRFASGAGVTLSSGGLTLGGAESIASYAQSGGTLGGAFTLTSAGGYALSGGTVNGNLGAGTMNVTTGTVNLNGTSAATSVNVNSGTLALGGNERLDDGATVTVAGGILDTGSGLLDLINLFNMSSGSLNGTGTITAGTYELSGGTVTANLGTGTLNVTGTVALNGTSDASAVNVSSGSLTLGSANRLANAAAVAVSGGSLVIAGFDDTVGTVSLTGGSITGSGGTLTGSSYAVQSGSISAKLGGAGGLTKTTGGTVSLSAANTYTGPTTIQAGILELLTGGSLASSSIVVGDTGSIGAVLDAIASGLSVASGQTVSGIGTINGNTTIQSGGFLAPGNSTGILTNIGNMNLVGGSTFQVEINGLTVGTGYDQLNVTDSIITGPSTVTLAGLLSVTTGFSPAIGDLFFLIDNDGSSAISGVFSNAPVNGNTYTFGSQPYEISYFGDYDTLSFTGGNDFVLRAVPEPGAALLGGIGLLFLLRRRRNG